MSATLGPPTALGSGTARPPSGDDRRLGRYEVLYHIAAGGMGVVYRAWDAGRGRDVALKVLPPDLAAQPALLQRFRQEAQNAARLRHENVVGLYEFGEAGSTCFLALEFVDGPDLRRYVAARGRLDPGEARQVLLQAARALGHTHARGVVHRDLKPSNFLVARPGGRLVVKLTDLGLARALGDAQPGCTRLGTTVGTPGYMAPEQARDSRAADVRSDIYSLGCTLHFLLTGRPPFAGGGAAGRLRPRRGAAPPDVRQANPAVPADLAAVERRMLAGRPEDRFQSPAELVRALEGCGGAAPGSAPPGERAVAPPGTRCLVLYGPDRRPLRYFPLTRDVTAVGRQDPVAGHFPDVDLSAHLDEAAARRVSRAHALVLQSRLDDGFLLRPLPGNTGTQVEAEMARDGRDYPMRPGTRLILGGAVRLKFEVV
jgi:hypothetical protein